MNKPEVIYNFICKLEPYLNNANNDPKSCLTIALNLDKSNDNFLRLRLKLAESVYEIADFIEADQSNITMDRSWAEDLVTLLTMPLNNPTAFNLHAKKIYPHTKNFIGSQIRIWNLVKGKTTIPEEEKLKSIKEKSDSLIEDLINNNMIEPNVRAFMIKQLRKIIEAIDYYQIYGNEGLINILEESIGHAFTNKKYEDFLKSDESSSWKEYLAIVSSIIATSDSFISLTNNLKNFLP